VHVNPHAWISTIPLLGLMLAVYFQPDDNVIKRWWLDIRQLDARTLMGLTGNGAPTHDPRLDRIVFWALVLLLAAGSLLSLAGYAGLLGD
jgi:hypothetical protein